MKTGQIHATVRYMTRLLTERPDFAQYIEPPITAEEALAELAKMKPDDLVSCGREGCPDCG